MRKLFALTVIWFTLYTATFAQEKNEMKSKLAVPLAVKIALSKKYPDAGKVTWERENGNYEANWGGKSGEDNSVQFTPAGEFIEIVNTIAANQLPTRVIAYLNGHYTGAKITEAGKVTDSKGKLSYEAEVNKKEIIFDEKGNFIKAAGK